MRNTLKITVLTLALASLTGCMKDKDEYKDKYKDKDGNDTRKLEITPSGISGTWKITEASTFISPNYDGSNAKDTDLLKEGDKVCEYNSSIVITETTFTIKTGGNKCTPDNKDIVYDWKENTTEKNPIPNAKDIDLLQNGKVIKTLQSFILSNNGKKITYNIPTKNSALQFTLTKM